MTLYCVWHYARHSIFYVTRVKTNGRNCITHKPPFSCPLQRRVSKLFITKHEFYPVFPDENSPNMRSRANFRKNIRTWSPACPIHEMPISNGITCLLRTLSDTILVTRGRDLLIGRQMCVEWRMRCGSVITEINRRFHSNCNRMLVRSFVHWFSGSDLVVSCWD